MKRFAPIAFLAFSVACSGGKTSLVAAPADAELDIPADVADVADSVSAADVPDVAADVPQDLSATKLEDAAEDADAAPEVDAQTVDAVDAIDAAVDPGPPPGPDLPPPPDATWTVQDDCVLPDAVLAPACMTVKCSPGFACMGAGKCVPDQAFVLPDGQNGQNAATLATRPDGAWAVAWYDGTIDTEMHVFLQVSLSSTAQVGPTLQIDDPGPHASYAPTLVALAQGTWLVIWREEQWMQSKVRFLGRKIATDGSHVLGPAFELTPGWQGAGGGSTNIVSPVATRLRNDALLVAWPATGSTPLLTVHARLLDADGTPQGPELDIGAGGPNEEAFSPAIAALPEGRSLLVWQQATNKGPVRVFGRQFSASGDPLDAVQQFSPGLQPYEALPDAVAFADGAPFLTWKSADSYTSTTAVAIQGERFGPDLTQLSAFSLQTAGADPLGIYPDQAAAVSLASERIAIVWHNPQDPSDVLLRRYYRAPDLLDCTAQSVALDDQPTQPTRYLPAAVALTDGRILVAWNETNAGLPLLKLRFMPW